MVATGSLFPLRDAVHGSMDEKGLRPHNPEPLIQLVFTQEGEIGDAGTL